MSRVIRSLITCFEPKEKQLEGFYRDLDSIRKVENVLNQIARRMNYLGYVENEKNLRNMSKELNDLILNIRKKSIEFLYY